MTTVLIFNFTAFYSPHLEVMAAIALREKNNGANVLYYSCDGSLGACEADYSGAKIACSNCQKRTDWAAKVIQVKPVSFSVKKCKKINYTINENSEIKSFVHRGINIGLGCASTYISWTRDQELTLTKATKSMLSRQLSAAAMMLDELNEILDAIKPDKVYLFNGRGFINRSIVNLCESRGVNYTALEVGANDERIEEYHNSLPHSISTRTKMMYELWQSADPVEKFNNSKLFFDRKRLGEVTNDKSYVSGHVRGLLPIFPKYKEIIAIFNSSDDEVKSIGDEWSFSAEINQFDVVESLLEKTIDDDVFFILRMHPNLASVKASWVKKWDRIKKFKNCFFVDSRSEISSYEILEKSNKVLVFGSTIGVEAVAVGKPVILYGNSFYERLDICYVAKSVEDIRVLSLSNLQPKEKEGALMYAYFLMNSGKVEANYSGSKKNGIYFLLNLNAPVNRYNLLRSDSILSATRHIDFKPGEIARHERIICGDC